MLRELFQPGCLPIGVDISPTGAKLLQLRRARGGYSLIAAERVDLEPRYIGETPETRLRAVVEGIRHRLEAHQFAGGRCVLSVGDELLRVRSVRQPRMPREEADSALRLEGAERLGFTEGEECEIGWLPAGEVRQGEDVRDETILVGARREDVVRVVDAVAGAGLRPVAVEPAFVAAGRAFSRTHRRAADQSVVRLIVDVGPLTTGVIVLRGVDVVFYKSLAIGGVNFDRVASEQLDLDHATASDLRRRRKAPREEGGDSDMDASVDRAMFDAVRPLLDQLATEVALCLRYFTVTFRGQRPVAALVAGSESREPGLVDILGQGLTLEARVARPLEGVDTSGARGCLDRRSDMVDWHVAAGLSMRGDRLGEAAGRAAATADADTVTGATARGKAA